MKHQEKEEDQEKILFRAWQEKDKLSLRKNKIFNQLFTKRKLLTLQEEQNKSKYLINISLISTNQELISNPELYIKTKFDIQNYFPYLISENILQIKEVLYLIDLYIKLQINEIPIEKRALSNNDYELINCLCHYLNYNDKQIAFYSCKILNELGFFNNSIEKMIYSEKNLKEILTFFNKNNFEFGTDFISLLINCCDDSDVRKFLVDNKIIERISFLINNNLDELENRYYIYLIKLLCSIIKLFYEYEEYYKTKRKKWFEPLLPFFKKTLKNNFVENPWQKNSESIYYVELLTFFSILADKDVNLTSEIIKDDFDQVLIEFYYKLDEEYKIDMMKVFVNLLSNDDSINETFINEGILGLLINEINRIEYKNNKLLYRIFQACSNIACGTLGQVEQLYAQGLLWKAIDISYYFITQNIINFDINEVIYNGIFTLNQAILGGSNEIKAELIIYQEYLIVNLYYLALKNYGEKKSEIGFLAQMGNAISKLISCGEGDLDQEIFEEFRNKFIIVGMEELIDNILGNYKNELLYKIFSFILNFIQENDN